MTPTDLTSTLNQADSNPWRAILQLGLGLGCMVLGGLAAIGLFGPSLMGSSLTSSHFSTLKNRIHGVLDYDQSFLSWMDDCHIKGLRLVDTDENEVFKGSLQVPRLLDWWSLGLIPNRAHASLDELNLTMDADGNCNLLDNLAARAGVSKVSPFLDSTLLTETVSYDAVIDRFIFEDQRSTAGPVTWDDSGFDIGWRPDGPGHLDLYLGGDQLEVNLDWQGIGESFVLASLRGKVTYEGPAKALEALLGFPGGIIGSLPDHLRISLSFAGKQDALGDEVSVEILIWDAMIRGIFDGKSFKMTPSAEAPNLGMRRFAGLNSLLEGLTAGMPETMRSKLRLGMEEGESWKWMLEKLETGITPIDWTLPFLEGVLASSRLELGYKMASGLTLAPQDNVGQSLDLGQSTLDWSYDPEVGRGRGLLKASMALGSNMNNVASLMLGANKNLRKNFELKWTGPSPMPSVATQLQATSLTHAATGFFSSHLPSWGSSLAGVLGNSCSVDIRRLDPNSAEGKHGGLKPSWEITVAGVDTDLGDDLVVYVGDGALWMDADKTKNLQLQPGLHGGIYDAFFSRFLPWFDSFKVGSDDFVGGELLVEVSNLIFRGKGVQWRLDEGIVELPQLDDVDYRIKRGWKIVWGEDETQALESIAYEVQPGRVHFEDLLFPIGTLTGSIDFDNDRVDMNLDELNPIWDLLPLPDEYKTFAKGLKVTGQISNPEYSMPYSGSSQDS